MSKTYVNVSTCPLFNAPSKSMILTDELLYGMEVEIIEDYNEWVKIKTEYRYEGFCLKENLIESEIYPDAFIISPFIDILSEAKYSSVILESLPRGSKIKTTNSVDGWSQVLLYSGAIGYIRNEHIIRFEDYLTTDIECIRKQVIDLAKMYLGVQYRWGGKSPLGIDCSGLTSIVYLLNGIHIYRDALIKEDFGMKEIGIEEMQPADLIYFPGHVAIYIGNDQYIHSTGASAGVVINSLNEKHLNFREDLKYSITGIATVLEAD